MNDAASFGSYNGLLPPIHHWDTSTEPATAVYDPPLSPTHQAILDDLTTMSRFGIEMTLAEWRAIKADAAGLRAYLGVASPTAAQTAAAVKAIVRVLATIIRD